MPSERKTLNISAETHEYLTSVGEKQDDESADAFLFRVAEMLDGSDAGMDVTQCNIGEDALTTEEFRAYMSDFASQIPKQTADEIEGRFR